MTLETVVLGFLNEGSMTGYDLSKRMDASVGFFWHATHPQIYTCLKKLESEGLVTFSHEIQETGPARKVYTITSDGKRNFLETLKTNITTYEIKFPLLVAMFHGSELGAEHWIVVLEAQLAEQKSKLQLYETIRNGIPDISPNQDIDIYLKRRTVEFGISYQKHFIRWLEETLQAIQS